jgi:hypothetical protein
VAALSVPLDSDFFELDSEEDDSELELESPDDEDSPSALAAFLAP